MPKRPDELLRRLAYAGCLAVWPDNFAGRPEG